MAKSPTTEKPARSALPIAPPRPAVSSGLISAGAVVTITSGAHEGKQALVQSVSGDLVQLFVGGQLTSYPFGMLQVSASAEATGPEL